MKFLQVSRSHVLTLCLSLLASLAALAPSARAQSAGQTPASCAWYSGADGSPDYFSGFGLTNAACTGPTFESNVVWCAAPAHSIVGSRLLDVTFTGDTVGNHLRLYTSTNSISITNASTVATNQLWLQNGSGIIASNDVILIQNLSCGAYQRCLVTNSSPSQIGIWPNASPNAVGDVVWKMTQVGALLSSLGVKTNYNRPTGVFFGRKGSPLLCDMLYSNTASISSMAGDYPVPARR